jgi:catalase
MEKVLSNSKQYLAYSDAIETPAPDEQQTFAELGETMQYITRTMADRYRHAYRPVHAKSHGVVKAKLEVLPGLPVELAQGLFSEPRTYDALLRFSTNPGDMLADNVSSPRGLAIKIMSVDGETLSGIGGLQTTSQDFVCVNGDVFSAPDPKGFLSQIKTFAKTLTVPEGMKHGISVAARATNAVLKVVGAKSATLEGIGAPAVHPLGESFTTVAPLRYGAYVAKIGFAPASENLTALMGKGIDLDESYNALRDEIRTFFKTETGVWDVKAQLALADIEKFPIEKADVKWDEEESPWITIATITALPQESYSDARQVFVDEQVGFNPWHALAAHRPLGGIMRSRKFAYEEAQKYRAQRNARERVEPKSLSEIPD